MSFKYERFLVEAIEQCHFQKVISCIKHGHNIHIKNDLGQNLLVHLLKQHNCQDPLFEKKRFHIFQFLIKHCNLDIQTFDYYGKNLFNWTTNLNCTQEALYLLNTYPGDIDILIRDHLGLCSLHYAIEHGNEILVHAIVDYLLQYRIRFDILDNHNNTPEELAKKLGYYHLSDYLSETSRLTIYMSKEIPYNYQRLMTTKSKVITATAHAKSAMTTISTVSSVSTSLPDFSDFHTILESKIEAAKNLNDWKTIGTLRAYQANPNTKKTNQLFPPPSQINRTTITSTPKFSKLPPVSVITSSTTSSGAQSTRMLHLLEPQLSSSYRRAFVPYYPKPVIPTVGVAPTSMAQRRMSIVSSRRMSSVMSMRKRESNASQLSLLNTQDGQNRLSLPQGLKQNRQSMAPSRTSDTEGLAKLRSKNLITSQN